MNPSTTSGTGGAGASDSPGIPESGDARGVRPFRELVPEARERAALLQEFAFRQLPEAVGQHAFLAEPDPDAVVHRLFRSFVERRRGIDPGKGPAFPSPSDLGAVRAEVAGRTSVLVRLPHPEYLPGAYFLLVFPTPALERPCCFVLERAESPWGREIGMVSCLVPGSGGRRNHGIAVVPTAAAFLAGVDEALRRHGEPGLG